MSESRPSLTVPLHQPSDEVDADRLRVLLEQAGIECHVVSFQSRAYPGVHEAHGKWGEIRVAREDHARARALLRQALPTEPVVPRSSKPPQPAATARSRSFPTSSVVLMGLLLMSGLANAVQCAQLAEQERPVDSEGRPILAWENAHTLLAYDTSGRLVDKLFDRDGSGRFEHTQGFHQDKLVAEWFDRDGDGLYEEFWSYKGGVRTARAFDQNGNGIYERTARTIGLDARTLDYPEVLDLDDDGLADRVICRNEIGLKREFDAEACKLGEAQREPEER